ncbi:transcriptional repressor [Oscillospiraceae bacterium MB08-C2-2]|nr:transcriptional repressor [Oscillospiraceae bacterium MB08-C2-2]
MTAGQITKNFQRSDTPMGMATVYRQLAKLVAAGKLRRYMLDGVPSACYEYVDGEAPMAHFHLKCECCGALIALECQYMEELQQHIAETHTFTINRIKTVFYGKCSRCIEHTQAI